MSRVFLPIIDNGGGSVKASWAMCMLTSFGSREVHIERVSDSHADRACNKACSLFLASDCSDMLIIDTDVLFNAKDIDRILSHDVPLVCGIYPKKSDETIPCLGTHSEVDLGRADGLVEVRWAGRGFLRVRREVLEAMKEENGGPALRFHNYGENTWNFFASGPVEGEMSYIESGKREWVSEDILFCVRAKQLGFPVYVDPFIALGHEGSKQYFFSGNQVTRMDNNITSWREINGWFDFENVYRDLVKRIPDGGKFAEVGCWLGRSLGAFADFAKEAGKRIELHAVDTFEGEPANETHASILAAHGGNVEKMFRANIAAIGLNGELTVHAMPSEIAAGDFADGSLDAVFIDADHHEDAVKADIEAWWPKVKRGGILAGHDIDESGVKAGVASVFDNYQTRGRCWLVNL